MRVCACLAGDEGTLNHGRIVLCVQSDGSSRYMSMPPSVRIRLGESM